MSMKLISKVYFSRIIISNKIIGKKVSPSCFNGVFPSSQNVTCAWEMEPHTHTHSLSLSLSLHFPVYDVTTHHSVSVAHTHTLTHWHTDMFSPGFSWLTQAGRIEEQSLFTYVLQSEAWGTRTSSHPYAFFPGKVWRSSEKGREREKVSRDRRNFGHGKTHIGRDRTKCS